jgi:putative methionine-R-sulfoxide reductase with GAF domain
LQEQAAVALASQLTPRLLSQLVWCLGQLHVQPQKQLMRQLLLHSARQLKRQQCNSQDCAQLLQGLAQLQQQLPVQWMGLYFTRVEQVCAGSFSFQRTACALALVADDEASVDKARTCL